MVTIPSNKTELARKELNWWRKGLNNFGNVIAENDIAPSIISKSNQRWTEENRQDSFLDKRASMMCKNKWKYDRIAMCFIFESINS